MPNYTKGEWRDGGGWIHILRDGMPIALVHPKHIDGFIASEEMYEALRELIHKFRVAGEILNFTEAHLLKELEQAEQALNRAEGK